MTLVNTDTGEIVEISYADVRTSIDSAKASLEEAAEQIVWQIENRVWTLLGYDNWNAMREAEYGGAAFMVPRDDRPELVTRMRRAGLTQHDIAATAGISRQQVGNDLRTLNAKSGNEPTPTIMNVRGQARPAAYTPRALPSADEAVVEFPDLAYYAETGRLADVVNMAGDLRIAQGRGELDQRLDTLRRSIAVDRSKRDGTYRPGTTAVMGDDGAYRMTPLPAPATTTRTCPTCNGRGSIEETQ